MPDELDENLNDSSKKKRSSPLADTRRSALNSLSRRDHSRQELKQKLRRKGFATQEIESVVANLAQEKLLDENRFVENYLHWRSRKGYGPERIALELKARGISDEMIAEHLKITDNAWFVEARRVWQKHFKGQIPRDFKDRAKQMRFLQYRGFTREQIEYYESA